MTAKKGPPGKKTKLIVGGRNVAHEAIENDKALQLYYQDGAAPAETSRLKSRAHDRQIPCAVCPETTRKQLYQDVAVVIDRSALYRDLESVLNNQEEGRRICVLDGVTDPQNMGSILRSAAFFGITAVIIGRDRSADLTETVIRVSAGGVFRVPLIRVTNISRALETLKQHRFWVYGTVCDDGGTDISEIPFDLRSVLVFGGEGPGLRPNIRKHCDFLVTIPGKRFDSLNVAVSAGVFFHRMVETGPPA